jgi:ATP-dependent Clp protease adaptor protein ClpS
MTNRQPYPDHQESGMTKDSQLQCLILHNDEINTFDYVISTLIEECCHESHQAEQCALIAHYKGQCDILLGIFNELQPIRINLLNKGLTVTIDDL